MIQSTLFEQIVTQPPHLARYLTNRIKLIEVINATVLEAKQIIKTNEHDDGMLRYAMQKLDVHIPSDYDIDLTRVYHLESLRGNLDSIRRYGASQFLQYAVGTLGYIEPLHPATQEALVAMGKVPAILRDYGFEPNDADPEYQAAMAMVRAYLTISKLLPPLNAMIAHLRREFADMEKRLIHNYQPEKYRPDHQPVERLYHASIYAAEIVRDGFAAEKPESRLGVGNFGNQQLISFTHRLAIAHDIMRAFREMWMIVHGQLTRRQIIGWMQAEGIDVTKAEGLYASRNHSPVESTVALYRGYLGYSKLRTDPTFVSAGDLIPALQDRQFADIGIIACNVRLAGNEEYMHAEAEFRLPASSVIPDSITRLV